MTLAEDQQVKRIVRKAGGVFYTPEQIVKYILDRTLSNHDVVANPVPRVLDPACGSGNFLVAAYDMLLSMFNEKLPVLQVAYGEQQYPVKIDQTECYLDGKTYWHRENLHYHIVHHCLYGADIDESAIYKAQERLLQKDKVRLLNADDMNLIICDSLIKWEDSPAQQDGYDNKDSLQLSDFWRQQYDYVIGNPPYVSFGLNRVGKVTAVQDNYFRANYPHSAQYKLSYYALFLERGLLAVKPGGYLGYITPDSYLLGRYYSKIREFILDSCCIQELVLVNNPVFSGAVVGIPAITILQKENNEQVKVAFQVTVKKINAESTAIYQYPQSYFCQQVYKRFRLYFSAQDKAIIDKLEEASCRFGDVAKIRTGMRSLTVQANIKSKTRHGGTWQPGLVSSAQVLPFALDYQGDWLDVNPAKLNKGGWDKNVMAGGKIFLRQTGDKLIAAVDRNGYYHLNNIHSLVIDRGEIELEYLVVILNSRLMNYYYQTVTLEKGRSMAQVDIEMVEKLPLVIDKQRAGEVVALAKEMAGMSDCERRKLLYNEINKIVDEIYGLAESDIWRIKQTGSRSNEAKGG